MFKIGPMAKSRIVFIHGMFVTNQCWTDWKNYFEQRGYECFAPPWPLKDASPEELRKRHPDIEGEGRVQLNDIVSSFEKFITSLGGDTILIGHSMGGLVTQILLNKGIGSCGVVIDSAPPQGVFTTRFSFLKANWPVVNPFSNSRMPSLWTKTQFRYSFAAHLQGAELDAAYRNVVPQSKLVPRDSLTSDARIDYAKKKAPLLFIAGEKDNIIPPSLNKTNCRKYRNSGSRTDFREFPGRSHYLINDKGWEEIAAYISKWLADIKK